MWTMSFDYVIDHRRRLGFYPGHIIWGGEPESRDVQSDVAICPRQNGVVEEWSERVERFFRWRVRQPEYGDQIESVICGG